MAKGSRIVLRSFGGLAGLVCGTALGQDKLVTQAETAKPKPGPKYLNLRYNEDFSYLDGPEGSYEVDVFDPIKNIHLNEDWRLSLGGEFRVRLEAETNKAFGATRQAQDTFTTFRYMVHADLRYRDSFRAFVQGVAAKSASGGYGETRVATGIVGSANLRLGDRVAAVLEAQIAASPQRFRGIRHRAAWADRTVVPNQRADAPEHILLDPDFRKGYAHLRTYGLSFEGWLYHTHIDDLTDLAKAFPDTTIIFNHLGGPIGIGSWAGRRDEVFAAWKPAVAALAKCPNVVAKVGGIQMVVNGYGWHQRERPPTSDELLQANRDWYNYTIDQFGPDRCMFESNFPVDKLSCSYTVLWNQFKKLTLGFSDDERAAMFHDTAMRVYRLPRI